MTADILIRIILGVLTIAILVIYRAVEKKRQARFREELAERYGQEGGE